MWRKALPVLCPRWCCWQQDPPKFWELPPRGERGKDESRAPCSHLSPPQSRPLVSSSHPCPEQCFWCSKITQRIPKSHPWQCEGQQGLGQPSAAFSGLLTLFIPKLTAQAAFGSQHPLPPLCCSSPAHVPGFIPVLCLVRLRPYAAS